MQLEEDLETPKIDGSQPEQVNRPIPETHESYFSRDPNKTLPIFDSYGGPAHTC